MCTYLRSIVKIRRLRMTNGVVTRSKLMMPERIRDFDLATYVFSYVDTY